MLLIWLVCWGPPARKNWTESVAPSARSRRPTARIWRLLFGWDDSSRARQIRPPSSRSRVPLVHLGVRSPAVGVAGRLPLLPQRERVGVRADPAPQEWHLESGGGALT